MTIGTIQGVTDVCGVTDTDLIARQLISAQDRLSLLLEKESLTVPDTSSSLGYAVELLASSQIAMKPGAVNPRANFEIDGFKRTEKPGNQVDEYKDHALQIIMSYIDSVNGKISLPTTTVVGRRGVRVGDYTELSEDEEAVY